MVKWAKRKKTLYRAYIPSIKRPEEEGFATIGKEKADLFTKKFFLPILAIDDIDISGEETEYLKTDWNEQPVI